MSKEDNDGGLLGIGKEANEGAIRGWQRMRRGGGGGAIRGWIRKRREVGY